LYETVHSNAVGAASLNMQVGTRILARTLEQRPVPGLVAFCGFLRFDYHKKMDVVLAIANILINFGQT
jgi:hypothetical protein